MYYKTEVIKTQVRDGDDTVKRKVLGLMSGATAHGTALGFL